jgi:hypothetical protein
MTKALQDANRTQTCADFDPAPISKRLQEHIPDEEQTYTRSEILELVCNIIESQYVSLIPRAPYYYVDSCKRMDTLPPHTIDLGDVCLAATTGAPESG